MSKYKKYFQINKVNSDFYWVTFSMDTIAPVMCSVTNTFRILYFTCYGTLLFFLFFKYS